jgi:hypothetical protein
MFSHELYNVVHIVGLVLLMLALGGIALAGDAAGTPRSGAHRRTVLLMHGLGIFLILLGGFGMLARLGMVEESSWPGWLWVKIAVWGTLGLAAFVPTRYPRAARPLLLFVPVLAGLAAYMAIYKPF